MVQEGTLNLNVTLKGYPKNFWGLLDKVAHRAQQITQFHPKRRGLSLTEQGQTYSPKCKPISYPMKLWHLVGMGVPTAHTTQ